MKTFDELWAFTDKIPGSFLRSSGEKLYEYAFDVPLEGAIAEIGVDQGRSLSVMLEARRGYETTFVIVDSWESILIDNMYKVKNLLESFGNPAHMMFNMPSVNAARIWSGPLDLIHIDANHYEPNPGQDCEAWLPMLKSGGVACFHDYHPSWPAVMAAVDKHCAGWEDLGEWDSLAIRRKP